MKKKPPICTRTWKFYVGIYMMKLSKSWHTSFRPRETRDRSFNLRQAWNNPSEPPANLKRTWAPLCTHRLAAGLMTLPMATVMGKHMPDTTSRITRTTLRTALTIILRNKNGATLDNHDNTETGQPGNKFPPIVNSFQFLEQWES